MTRSLPIFASASHFVRRHAIGLLAAAALLSFPLVAWLSQLHPAPTGAVLAFHAAFVLMLGLAVPEPRSQGYTALAIFLSLGFWTKLLVRLPEDYPYLEPIGSFDHSPASWSRVLWTITTAIAAVILVRAVHVWNGRLRPANNEPPLGTAPAVYVRHIRTIWIGTAIVTAALYGWNAYAATQMTGLRPRVILPLHGNLVLSWWYIMALPLWLATLINWELARQKTRVLGPRLLLIVIAEAVVTSGSLLSRATYLLRLAPYLLATTARRARALRFGIGPLKSTLVLGIGFAASLAIVMLFRVNIYYLQRGSASSTTTSAERRIPNQAASPQSDRDTRGNAARSPTSSPGATPSRSPATGTPQTGAATSRPLPPADARAFASGYLTRPVHFAVREVGRLFLERWTGMEGVMAVTSTATSPALILEAVREDPNRGVEAIYQRIAGARYRAEADFTFLTLAGTIALLAMSGSAFFVFIGMGIATTILIGTEAATRRATHSEIACAVVGVGLAFWIAQATYPRLLAAFCIELWTTIAILWAVHRLLPASPPRDHPSRQSSATT